jgi:hypothetical protein
MIDIIQLASHAKIRDIFSLRFFKHKKALQTFLLAGLSKFEC